MFGPCGRLIDLSTVVSVLCFVDSCDVGIVAEVKDGRERLLKVVVIVLEKMIFLFLSRV